MSTKDVRIRHTHLHGFRMSSYLRDANSSQYGPEINCGKDIRETFGQLAGSGI